MESRLVRPNPRISITLATASCLLLAVMLGSCSEPGPTVVLYCALDQEHAADILQRFEDETGIHVDAKFDNEMVKTVGLRRDIQEEARGRTRCDVFWNNEIVNTIMLQTDGLLEPYESPSAVDVPAGFRDPEHHWTGFAARARVFIVNTEKVPAERRPSTTKDMLDPSRKNEWCIAKPITGTTATQVAVWFDLWGEDATKQFLMDARRNGLTLLQSNGMTMRKVREGQLPYGWTDTDDFNVALEEGTPVAAVYPDQGPEDPGCLVIPNTISLIKNAPHPDQAKQFIDFVLRRDIEELLAKSRSAQIPVRDGVPVPPNVRKLADLKVMKVDFRRAAEKFEKVARWMNESFLQGD